MLKQELLEIPKESLHQFLMVIWFLWLMKTDIKKALGLDEIKNPLPCGYIEMYEAPNSIRIPVHFNSHFLIGPEGAHLNISGISGLASKTSYAMFLLKAIQNQYLTSNNENESVAFVILNVKGKD